MSIDSSARCPKCGTVFELASIARHPDVRPIGMQFLEGPEPINCYFFNHVSVDCGTTFAVPVEQFMPWIREPVSDRALTGQVGCRGLCLKVAELAECRTPCRYAPFRRFLLQMRETNEAVRRDRAV